MPPTTLGIKLDEETRARLKNLGKKTERSPHWLMKKAIHEYLDREEKYVEQREEDRQRWERYVQTGAFINNDSMMSWLDDLADKTPSEENP